MQEDLNVEVCIDGNQSKIGYYQEIFLQELLFIDKNTQFTVSVGVVRSQCQYGPIKLGHYGVLHWASMGQYRKASELVWAQILKYKGQYGPFSKAPRPVWAGRYSEAQGTVWAHTVRP